MSFYNLNKEKQFKMKRTFSFAIENFRGFKTRQNFVFSPLTLLVGPNSSGKSSLIKFLSAFNTSVKQNLDWNNFLAFSIDGKFDSNDYLDLRESMSNKEEPLKIEFCETNNTCFQDFSYCIEYYQNQKLNGVSLKKFSINCNGQLLLEYNKIREEEITVDFNVLISQLINFSEFNDYNSFEGGGISKYTIEENEKIESLVRWSNKNSDSNYSNVLKSIWNELINENNGKIIFKVDEADHTINEMLLISSNFSSYISYILNHLKLIISSKLRLQGIFDEIELSLTGKFFQEIFSVELNKSMKKTFENFSDISKLPVFRTKRKKLFVINENLKSPFEIALNKYIETSIGRVDEENNIIFGTNYIDGWLQKFEIGESLQVKRIDKSNTIFTIEILQKNGSSINISDLGYGSGQVLSLILIPFIHLSYSTVDSSFELNEDGSFQSRDLRNQVTKADEIQWEEASNLINLYLEEPETNLHPNWQSLIAELLASHLKLGIRYIIETHSEYFVRKLQKMVAEKSLENDLITIHYFNSDKNVDVAQGEPKVKNILIKNNGTLSQSFGPGFFDESGKLSLDLLRINSISKN
jgi:predicted ATP-dependent endonuclease of OLD family